MDFSKVYDIKFNDLVIHFLPFPLRKSKMIAWLRSLVKPIVNPSYSVYQLPACSDL